MRQAHFFSALLSCFVVAGGCFAQSARRTMTLEVDATEAARHVFHSRLAIPVSPGPLTLFFPKWIPGDHAPAGWINGLAGLKLTASGKPVIWQRDAVDMYAFHCDMPAGADVLEVKLDFLSPLEQMFFTTGGTENLADINWESMILYPADSKPAELLVAAKLRLPAGWQFASALAVDGEPKAAVSFAPVPLSTLVDSPLIAGRYFTRIPLTAQGALHELDVVADSEAAMQMPPEMLAAMRNLPDETQSLFGSRHYREYRFLLTLSDPLGTDGLEHHECSDNRTWERFLTNKDARYTLGYLLPHEFIHSWNGKYRRPAGLATSDFQQPMNDKLLWVYEGLTHYLCYIMTARAGFETPEQTREMMAYFAARLEHTPGRTWRPLIDTAVAAQLLYDQPAQGAAWRRGVDYYNEGMLIWLDADVTIRQKTAGKESLDDFCRLFFAGASTAPSVKTYTRQDVEAALDSVCHADWHEFFEKRIYRINEQIPLDGIRNGGWEFIYDDTPNLYQDATETTRNILDTTFSIGLRIGQSGSIVDIVPGSPADKAGVPVGSKLLAVNGRKYSDALLREAIARSAHDTSTIDLLAENQEFSRVYHVNYHDGAKYPHFRRRSDKPDLLSQIMAPLRPAVTTR